MGRSGFGSQGVVTRFELLDARIAEGAGLSGQIGEQRAGAFQPRRQTWTFVSRLRELARQIVDAAAIGARVDDAKQHVARRQRGARFPIGRAGLQHALDWRAQGDDARVDDRLDAGGLRQALHRFVADCGDEREPEQRLDDAPGNYRLRL